MKPNPRHPAAALCATLLAACAAAHFLPRATFAQDSAAPSPAVINWIRSNAIPLKTVEAGNGFEDMRPLGKVVGDARIVALGEATHGTHEFYQLKQRMIEYLAADRGFSVLAIEANMPEANRVNDFIETGAGDPAQLLKALSFWTWDSQEFLNVILWIRQFNQSGRGHIEFTGMDMTNPESPLATVQAFVESNDREDADTFRKLQEGVNSLRKSDAGEPSPELADAAGQLVERLEARRSGLAAKAGAKETDWAIQNARLIHQFVEWKAGKKSRDECMAENAEWIAERSPKAKIILWAHNAHVAYQGLAPGQPQQTMGGFLHKEFGKAMVNFGTAFNEGSFRSTEPGKGLHEFTVGSAPAGSLDATLAAARLPRLALDLRHIPAGPAADFFHGPHASRSIGSRYSDSLAGSLWYTTPAAQAFDVLLFVEKTSAAKGIQ